MYRLNKDTTVQTMLRTCAISAGLIVVLIIFFVALESAEALRHVGFTRFFTDASWHPAADGADGSFNLAPMIAATLLAACGAVMIAAPMGVVSAVFVHFYAPSVIARVYRPIIELLAGIPSVVYGLWGLVVLVPLLQQIQPPGQSLLAGILILIIMVLPTMALMAETSIAGVAQQTQRAAAALGLSQSAMIWRVIVPAARRGLFTATILTTGRAIGETMAVLMVCGNIVQTPGSLFDPVRTLTANMALEMGFALGDHRSALFVSGLVLLTMVVILIAIAEYLSRGRLYG